MEEKGFLRLLIRQRQYRSSLLQCTVIKNIDQYYIRNMKMNFFKILQPLHGQPVIVRLVAECRRVSKYQETVVSGHRINYTFIIYSILSIHLSWNDQDTYANLKRIHCNFVDALKEGQHNIFISGLLFFPGSPFTSREILALLFCIITCPAQWVKFNALWLIRPEGIIMAILFDLLHNLSYRIPLCGSCIHLHSKGWYRKYLL